MLRSIGTREANTVVHLPAASSAPRRGPNLAHLCAPDGDQFPQHLDDDAAARAARVVHGLVVGLATGSDALPAV